MLHQNQTTKRLNTTEVIPPTETSKDDAGAMPVSPNGLSGAGRRDAVK
jgi:hypothetical protein